MRISDWSSDVCSSDLCKQKIRGWVEVVFTVMPNGHVANVKLVDANPRGVFEAAAIESISNWIYDSGDRAREVKQRRSEERRVGKECVSTCRSRVSPDT